MNYINKLISKRELSLMSHVKVELPPVLTKVVRIMIKLNSITNFGFTSFMEQGLQLSMMKSC